MCTQFEYDRTRYGYERRGGRSALRRAFRKDAPEAPRLALHSPRRSLLRPRAHEDSGGAGGRTPRARDPNHRGNPPANRSRQAGLLPGERGVPHLRGAEGDLPQDGGSGRRAPAGPRVAGISDPCRPGSWIECQRHASRRERHRPRRDRGSLLRRGGFGPFTGPGPARPGGQSRRLHHGRVSGEGSIRAPLRDELPARAPLLRRGRAG